jgi:hypothetical protein
MIGDLKPLRCKPFTATRILPSQLLQVGTTTPVCSTQGTL